MRKGEVINGYTILEDFKVAGGMSMVSFAEKGGKEFFIKEFLSPKYPTPDSPGSERIKEQKRKACDAFEKHHRDLNAAIGKCCAGTGGNLIYALDFFRYGASYYKVTDKVDVSSLSITEISKLPIDKILLIAKSATHSIRILHKEKIVHGDLKPDNLLIKEVSCGFVAKLIDFDDSYFEGNPPNDRENLVGTPEYYSPEQAEYITDEDDEVDGSILTCKSDIFSLGIIFSEYFTGCKPILPEKYSSVWSCVQNAGTLSFKGSLNSKVERLIRRMLSLRPIDRPNINEVFEELKKINEKPGGIRGKGLGPKPIGPEGKPGSGVLIYPTPPVKTKSETDNHLRGKGLDIARK